MYGQLGFAMMPVASLLVATFAKWLICNNPEEPHFTTPYRNFVVRII